MPNELKLYAARDTSTGKLVSDITNPKRKYWDKRGNAVKAIEYYNKYYANENLEKYMTVMEINTREYGQQTVVAVDDLQYLPTADVVEVKHGYGQNNTNGTFTCSVCGGKSHRKKFCGDCGAKMDRGILEPTTAHSIKELKEILESEDNVSLINDKSNRCVSCGVEIPEGTMVCPSCERRWE